MSRVSSPGRTGLRLRVERLRRGWTQERLSELTGIRQHQLCSYERGRVFPDERTIGRLAAAFGESDDVIFRWLKEPNDIEKAEVA